MVLSAHLILSFAPVSIEAFLEACSVLRCFSNVSLVVVPSRPGILSVIIPGRLGLVPNTNLPGIMT